MKKVMLTIGVLFIMQSVSGQTESIGNWIMSINAGIEAHDKRLFDYSEKESLLEMQPEFWGTYHLGFSLNRKFIQNERFSSFIGLGIGYENATFLRPFDHFHFEEDDFLILRNLNKYEKVHLSLSYFTFFEFVDNWFLSGEVNSNVILFKSIDQTENGSGVFPYTEGAFELDNFELELGVNYKISSWIIGLHSRVVNFQKIDRIIFNDLIKDPRTDQKWEWHNPLHFDLTVGYTW